MERTIKQAELSNEVNFSDQVTSRNNEETSFVQALEVEGLPNNSNEIFSESTRHLCTNSEIESGFNQNINTVCQQKFDVDSSLSSIMNYCNNIIEGTPIPMNSRQTDESRKLLESLNGLSEQISQKDYLEYVNDWTESYKNEIGILNKSPPSINQNLNQTNGHLEMRNKQKGETAVDNNKLSLADAKYGQSKQIDLMLNDLQSMTNDITRMEQNLLYNCHIQQSKNDQISRNSTYDVASLSDSSLSSKEETSEPESSKELHPNASVKRHSVDLNKVMQKSSTRKHDSNADMLIYKEKKVHVCDVCHESFKWKSDLKKHFVMHSDERPFTCEVCNKTFKMKHHLKRHTNIHTGKKFSCKVCNKSFTHQSYLATHELFHSGKRPYLCKICGKSFTQSTHLKRHKLTHTGEKPFECPFCNKKFFREDNLNKHLITYEHK